MDVTSNSAGADSHDASTELRVRKRSADGMKRGSTHSRKKATAADNAAANAGGPIYDKVVLPAPDNAAVGDRTSIYDVLKPVQQSHEAYAMISHNQNAQYDVVPVVHAPQAYDQVQLPLHDDSRQAVSKSGRSFSSFFR